MVLAVLFACDVKEVKCVLNFVGLSVVFSSQFFFYKIVFKPVKRFIY